MRGLSRIVPRTPRRLLWPHRRNPCRGFSELGPLRFHALPAHSHSIADLLLTYWYIMDFSWPHTPQKCRQGQSPRRGASIRSEEHTSELQSLMRHSYAVFCLKKKTNRNIR